MSEWEEFTAYAGIIADAKREERERIRANILERVQDLTSCNKNDDCNEWGQHIQGYIQEWLDDGGNK